MSLKNSVQEQIPEPADILRCYWICYYFDENVFYLFLFVFIVIILSEWPFGDIPFL